MKTTYLVRGYLMYCTEVITFILHRNIKDRQNDNLDLKLQVTWSFEHRNNVCLISFNKYTSY